jgi:hypothetical protein
MNEENVNIEKKDNLIANINTTFPNEKKDEKENITIIEEKKQEQEHVGCCEIICFLICSIIIILLELILNFFLVFIFIYYYNNHKQCEAKLYPKIITILYIYLAMLIIEVLIIIITIIISLNKDRCKEKLSVFSLILTVIFGIATFALQLTNLIIVQKYYNESINWDNCGNFKGWTVFWLVINYISLIFGIISKCCLKDKENND